MEPGLQHHVTPEPSQRTPHVFRRKSGIEESPSKELPTNEGLSVRGTAKRILSVSYDYSLLMTREMLLVDAGFQVTSVKSLPAALDCCKRDRFDLVIVGHSIPRTDKQAVVRAIKALCPTPLLSIRKHGEEPLHEADHSVDSHEGPIALLEAVNEMLGQ